MLEIEFAVSDMLGAKQCGFCRLSHIYRISDFVSPWQHAIQSFLRLHKMLNKLRQ